MRYHRPLMLGAALCLAVARAAQADPDPPYHFFSTTQIHINDSAPFDLGSGIVGWSSADLQGNFQGASSPTVTYSSGAGWINDMYVFNGSTLNVSGGTPGPTIQPGGVIYGPLYAHDSSKVNVSEQGSVPFMNLYDTAALTMSGGDIGKVDDDNDGSGLYANGSSTVNISGGFVFRVEGRDNSKINITGGLMTIVTTAGAGCSATISGGVIVSAGAGQGSTMNISGGNFTSVSCTDPGSLINFSGGTVATSIFAGAHSTFNFNSGSAASALCEGGILNIDAPISGAVTVMGGQIALGVVEVGSISATQSTVNLLPGCVVAGDVSENGCVVAMFGAMTIHGNVDATDGFFIVVAGGTIGGTVTLHGSASVSFAGSVGGALNVQGSSVVTMTQGSIGNGVTTANFGTFNMNGGSINSLSALNSSSLALSGGSVTGTLDTYNSSVATISNSAEIDGKVSSHNSSQIIVNNGVLLSEVDAYDSSTIQIASGIVAGPLRAFNGATIIWAGGVITGTSGNSPQVLSPAAAAPATVSIYAYDNANIIIRGVHLSSTLLDGNNSDGTNTYSLYQLSGFLGDGSTLTSNIQLYVQHPTTTFTTGGAFQFMPADQTWNTAASGSWAAGSNWLPAIAPGDPGSSVVFNDPGTGIPITIALDGDHSMGNFTIAGIYTFNQGSAGTLFLNNNGGQVQFLAGGGAVTINAPVVAQDSTLVSVQDTALKLTAGITVAAGKTLAVAGDSPLQTAFVRGGTVKIQGGTVRIIPNGTPASLSRVENLVILDQSILDLTNNDMIVTASSPAAILTLLQTTYKISSSTATPGMGVGMLSGAQYLALHPGATFDGAAVAGTDVLLKYAPLGDGDLDGYISLDDYLLIDAGFANQSSTPSWINGDFNYDGVVDGLDYALIDFSYMQQAGTQAAGEISTHTAEFGATYLNALDGLEAGASAVPEPASLALLAMGAALLAGRRHLRRRTG